MVTSRFNQLPLGCCLLSVDDNGLKHLRKVPRLMILCNYKFVNASVKVTAVVGAATAGKVLAGIRISASGHPQPVHSSLLMLSTMCGTDSSFVLCAFNYSAKMVLSLMVILCLLSILSSCFVILRHGRRCCCCWLPLLFRSTTKRVIRPKS